MKPTLLRSLPHLFRVIEKSGLSLPRKFFMPASEYKNIPARLKVDNVMPSVSDLPSLLTSIRHPGRVRSVSVGPQSAADAYETLAYREKRRRDSLTLSSNELEAGSPFIHSPASSSASNVSKTWPETNDDKDGAVSQVSGISASMGVTGAGNLITPPQSRVGSYEQMMGQGHVIITPSTPPGDSADDNEDNDVEILMEQRNELEEKEMFSRLEKPRVRYDVEVVTKLVVYTGKCTPPMKYSMLIYNRNRVAGGRNKSNHFRDHRARNGSSRSTDSMTFLLLFTILLRVGSYKVV